MATLLQATTSVFNEGNLKVQQIKLKPSSKSDSNPKPPTPLFVLSPIQQGTYPVLLFAHGFFLADTFYSVLLDHISSHGFIIVAIGDDISLLGILKCCIANDVEKAANVADWISDGGLQLVLPDKVTADLGNVAIAGHSKGGKTAFALALGLAETNLQFKTLIGIDPVAGFGVSCRTRPEILTYIPQVLKQKIPVAVIGCSLSCNWKYIFPPFAPHGCNHSEFYNECEPPVSYFLAQDYGHCDMLDDIPAKLASFVMQSHKGSKVSMRKSVGGIAVAFLNANLKGNSDDLNAIVKDPFIAPIKIDPVISVPNNSN